MPSGYDAVAGWCRGPGRSGSWPRRRRRRSGPGPPRRVARVLALDAPRPGPGRPRRAARWPRLPCHTLGARLLGPLGHQLVEVVAGDDVAVVGDSRGRRATQLERAAEGDRPQAVEAVVAPSQSVGQAHVVELLDRAGRQPVAAGLLPGEVLLLDEQDVVAGLGQPVGAGRSGRPAADDEDVVAAAARTLEPFALVGDDGGDLGLG